MTDDLSQQWDAAMKVALDCARAAAARGEVPVGAVVLDRHGEIVVSAGNEREATGDPTAHAEILALRRAASRLGSWRLDGTTLVVTLEPCVMCAGAALAARVARVVFGAASLDNGAMGSLYNVAVDPRLASGCDVISGVRADECAAQLSAFFDQRRP
mgnify:CR=1 FL=1|jgi:tRNA(adenine34) deaminase